MDDKVFIEIWMDHYKNGCPLSQFASEVSLSPANAQRRAKYFRAHGINLPKLKGEEDNNGGTSYPLLACQYIELNLDSEREIEGEEQTYSLEMSNGFVSHGQPVVMVQIPNLNIDDLKALRQRLDDVILLLELYDGRPSNGS